MAKVKKSLIESKRIGPLIYKERKSKKDGFTCDVQMKILKSKKKYN